MSGETESAWGALATKYEIHEEAEAFAKLLLQNPSKKNYEIPLSESHERFEMSLQSQLPTEIMVPYTAFGEEISKGIEGLEGIPVTVFKPSTAPPKPGILLFFHGGGLIVGSAASYASVPRYMAENTGNVLVNVDYRLLPNSKDPFAPFTDCVAATRWVLENRKSVGGADDSPVGVSGDSAGGQIVSIVCDKVKGLACQVIIYGVLGLDSSLPCCQEFDKTPIFSLQDFQWILDTILADVPDGLTNPNMNPAAIKDLTGHPPALVVAAELDPLRDDNLRYAERLKAAGVSTQMILYKGLPHAFMLVRSAFPKSYEEGYASVFEFLREHL